MEEVQNVSKIDSIFEKVKNVYKNNKNIILFFIGIVVTLYIFYSFSLSYNVSNRIQDLEVAYIKKNRVINQYNFCSDQLNHLHLTDFFINSSSKSALTGMQRFDYVSSQIIEKIIFFGVRYIELEIFSKTLKNETIPVVNSGKLKGEWKYSQNDIDLKDVLKKLSKHIFNEESIDNYKDPFFIFLDIKTSNKDTLNKVYHLLIKYFNDYLLGEKFNNSGKDLTKIKMCELMNKLILFSGDKELYQQTKLEKIINLSTSDDKLKRVSISDLNNYIQSDSDEPKFVMKSKNIKFKNDFNSDYIEIDDNVNFLEYNINKNYTLEINGSNLANNNGYFKPLRILENKIYFDKKYKIKESEKNNVITIKGYLKDKNLENLEERNKHQLMIVIPDKGILSKNYDPYIAFNYGCQFVAMFYQKLDKKMLNYQKFFNKVSIKIKPKNMQIYIKQEPKSIEQKKLGFIISKTISKLNIDFNFLIKFKEEIFIKKAGQCVNSVEAKKGGLFLANDKKIEDKLGIPRLIPSFKKIKCEMVVVEGLNRKPYSISFKQGDYYLTTTDNCCFTYFSIRPNDEAEKKVFDNNSSFYPTEPLCGLKNNYSFVIAKDENYKKNNSSYQGNDYSIPHFLKFRHTFELEDKLYTMKTKSFTKITSFENSNNQKINVYRVNPKNDYYSYGNIFTLNNDKPKEAIILSGAVQEPKDFELIWDNKQIDETEKKSVWRMIPYDNFIAIGVVFVSGSYNKPSKNLYRTINARYVEMSTFNSTNIAEWNSMNDSKYESSSSHLSFWKINNSNNHDLFFNNNKFKPNTFDNPPFILNLNEQTYKDRIYLSKVKPNIEDQKTSCFCVLNNESSKPDFESYTNALLNKNIKDRKIVSYLPSNLGEYMCININNPYKNAENKEVNLSDCKDFDYAGTNFNYYSDNTIRYDKDPSLCLTTSYNDYSKKFSIEKNKYIEKVGKHFLKKCNNSINQKFKVLNKKYPEFCSDNDNTKESCIKYNIIKTKSKDLCLSYDLKSNKEKNIELSNIQQRRIVKHLNAKTCSLNDKTQRWNISQNQLSNCISKDKNVFIFYKIKRGEFKKNIRFFQNIETYLKLNNVIENYDHEFYHVYIRGLVKETYTPEEKYYLVSHYISGREFEYKVSKNSENIILDDIPSEDLLKPGVEVICKNGDFGMSNVTIKNEDNLILDEEILRFRAIITQVPDKNDKSKKYKVQFSVNSIELDKKRDKKFRSGSIQQKFVSINDMCLLRKPYQCI